MAGNSLSHKTVGNVCLPTGSYYGEGRVRKKELLHSAAILGISGANVEIVNDQ